jgi:hypothetical protein
MSNTVLVQVIGAPIACKDGLKDSWREVARWAEDRLKAYFGEQVQVKYYDLFDVDCPPMPTESQLPVVLVNGETTINGGKIALPIIRRKVESVLEKTAA